MKWTGEAGPSDLNLDSNGGCRRGLRVNVECIILELCAYYSSTCMR